MINRTNKNNIFYFLLGIFLVILTSATTVSVMTVKPAIPKYTVCFIGNPVELQNKILGWTQKGYIVKLGLTTSQGSSGRYEVGLIVMEKY